MRKWLRWGGVLAAVAGGGWWAWQAWWSPASEMEVVRAARVTRGDLRLTISATGEVQPQNRVEIKPPIAGRVDAVLVREGEAVTSGQVVAWMSSSERAALLDAARSQGEAVLARWRDAYKPAPLMAPLDGTVIVRAVEPGQTVTAADPVVVVADRLIVQALVDETDLGMIRAGQEVRVRLDAYPQQALDAVVDRIAYESRLVNNVSVYAVEIVPEQVPDTFRSGMTANVTFLVTNRADVVLVPSEALAECPGKSATAAIGLCVFRAGARGGPVAAPVAIGETDGRMTEALDGVQVGEELLIMHRKERATGSNPFSTRRAPQRPQRSP